MTVSTTQLVTLETHKQRATLMILIPPAPTLYSYFLSYVVLVLVLVLVLYIPSTATAST